MKLNFVIVKSLQKFCRKPLHVASLRPRLTMSARMTATLHEGKTPNLLINERSPYLLQHAYNPVKWYPWGEEAFRKAKNESKLIFLSVGYSTCHWCHVMEKESFENEEIANMLNQNFVPVKVDREERPDVDRVYMTFVQATSGHGGWPMSVWLTPNLKPFVGGTYFPPDDSMFKRGFKSILNVISQKWNEDKDKCNENADKIMESIQKAVQVTTDVSATLPTLDACEKCVEQMIEMFDDNLGGFGVAPKFPQPVNFNFLLRYHCCFPETEHGKKALMMVEKTLLQMADGGIYDHIGYGFHRYSTDKFWHVPHFEKMLYDQGQLAVAYADCYATTGNEKLKQTLCNLLDYVKRDLTHSSGGFYSAEDADSLPSHDDKVKKEGAFYVFTSAELKEILPDKIGNTNLADIVQMYYGMTENGNVSFEQDPHGELRGKNVLIIRATVEEIAEKYETTRDDVISGLEISRERMFQKRCQLPRPHLDDKMLTAWNALMISGFARAACVTDNDDYRQVASTAAHFLKVNLYDESTNLLLRSCYPGQDGSVEQISPPIKGFDADYAFTIRSLIDLYEATHDDRWLEWASKLQDKQTELFWDDKDGGYFSVDQSDSSILLRMKEDQDGAEPSANSVSALNLLRLSAYLNQPKLQEQSENVFKAFSDRLRKAPFALPEMASGLLWLWKGHKQIVVSGPEDSDVTKSFVMYIDSKFLPFKIIVPSNKLSKNGVVHRHLAGNLSGMISTSGGALKPEVFVCENFTCQLPARSLQELKNIL
ncbi:spermatogenesis-associated protein 20-like isoform X2 [Clavelina lepadiformis]|uniref:spermatogenesis-associated protein 20-like isoform X2 n=1 Tax=Clavelina lepadiformis TaxID=159417 RepID=UPI00404258CC